MKIIFNKLVVACKKKKEEIAFSDFNYFWGKMGAGKSTIARLIDYCLGGDLDMTPALQSEFVSATLTLKIEGTDLLIDRNSSTDQIRAQWSDESERYDVLIPARKAAGEVVPNTEIEVISDLFFHLAGKSSPKVRRSKNEESTELERLSLRDLLWFCYLDQDTIDSNFFNLDEKANPFKRNKSRDVLRFIFGLYKEQIAELEAKLERLKSERERCEAGITAIREALSTADIATELELSAVREKIEFDIKETDKKITGVRNKAELNRPHTMEILQNKGRGLTLQIGELQASINDLQDAITKDKAHKNELLSLGVRFKRTQSAREVLEGVKFKECPSCGKLLANQLPNNCSVCGQPYDEVTSGPFEEKTAEKDLKARISELEEIIAKYQEQLRKQERRLEDIIKEKAGVDEELTRVSINYDSAYLAAALEYENYRSALKQQLYDLDKIEVISQKVIELQKRSDEMAGEEHNVSSRLKDERSKADKGAKILSKLKQLFLDSLLKAKIPGFVSDDTVEMNLHDFLPKVLTKGDRNLPITTFSNEGSNGKKTLFKCCFAVAIHRLAVEINATLPTFLIIDTPMKSISERENKEQFEGFYRMLYALSQKELKGTQFILIDKELFPPPDNFKQGFFKRHMKPDETENPPLISYYRGK